MRLAGPAEQYEKLIADFSRNIGVAFQILNDIKDWAGDEDNKLVAGQDVLAGPADAAAGAGTRRLDAGRRAKNCCTSSRSTSRHARARRSSPACGDLYFAAKVFEKADKLVDKFRAKAEALADEVRADRAPRAALLPGRFGAGEGRAAAARGATQFVELGR